MKNSLLLLLGLASLASSLHSQVLGARALGAGGNKTAATGSGPVLSPVPVAVSRRFVQWDGFTITKLHLTFARDASIEIGQQQLGDWQRRDQAPFAIAFTHPLAPEVRVGINYFSGSAASSLLAGNAWTSVPSSLPRNAKDVSRVIANDDSAVNPNMLRPLSWRTRVYEREITSAEPGPPPQRQVLVVIGEGTKAYLFTMEGNGAQVARLKENFDRLCTAFELVN